MKRKLLCLALSGGLAISPVAHMQAQPANLHKTVTHNPEGSGIKENSGSEHAARQTNAQEGFMPQKKHSDMQSAKYVQSFVNETMSFVHSEGTETGLPSDFHYNMAEWTQKDVTDFAKGAKTFDTYEILLGIANTSVRKEKGQYTQDALDAQAALEAIKPGCCNSWKGFARMIGDAADASQTVRDGYRKAIEEKKKDEKHGSIIELHKDVRYGGELPKGENPQVQALAVANTLKTVVRAA